MRPHLVYVKNSEATKETKKKTEQLNLVTFHSGTRSSQQEAIKFDCVVHSFKFLELSL